MGATGALILALVLTGCTGGHRNGPDPAAVFLQEPALELAHAVQSGDGDRLRSLAADGADLSVTGVEGTTLLQWAVRTDSHDGLVALLEAGADPDQIGESGGGALHLAAFSSNPEHLVTLLEAGADPDLRNTVTGGTALGRAVLNNVDEPFHLLLEAGADVNLADRNGGTALHTAARTNKGWAVLALLEHGADPLAESGGSSFQDYYWRINPAVLNDRARAERVQVIAWLEDNDVAVNARADNFREVQG